jgi:hypothetical protein
MLRVVDARPRSGGGEKITPSLDRPAILLVCDEIAVILGIGTGGPGTSVEGVTNTTPHGPGHSAGDDPVARKRSTSSWRLSAERSP